LTCKFIAHNIRRATLINLLGLAGASNATGDDQKKLDVLGNQIFLDTMKNCGKVGVIVSEEEDDVILIKVKGARYAVVCDPIDGILSPRDLRIDGRVVQFGCWCVGGDYFRNLQDPR
jgi:fructose-1,6-bisphosphatase